MTTIVDLERIPLVPLDFINADHREEGRLRGALRPRGGRHDAARLRKYVSSGVPACFVGHIESMDHVTAQFIASRGG